MTGVKSPCPPLQQAWVRAANHYATHDSTIRMIHAYTEYGTTTPDHYSHDASAFYAKSNCKDQYSTLATGLGMTGHVATMSKDRNHSLSSGTYASPCSSSARSTNATPLQYRPRHHRIRPPRGPRAASPTRISHTLTSCNPAPP
jgi:hypothetical protein